MRGFGRNLLSFKQEGQGFFQPQQTRQSHRAAAARQETQRDFRQAQTDVVVVQHDTMMAHQAEFITAAQCAAVDGSYQGLTQRFKLAHLAFQRLDRGEECLSILGLNLHDLGQVAACKEGFFSGSDNNAFDTLGI